MNNAIDQSMVTTACEIPGYTIIKSFGVVMGDESNASFFAFFKQGAFKQTYENALNMLINRAEELEANAIVGVHFSVFFKSPNSNATMIAYGTPVIVEKKSYS